eukprot:scaffold207_cov409-Prasinococcus_capsulatus_cf.AAC.70
MSRPAFVLQVLRIVGAQVTVLVVSAIEFHEVQFGLFRVRYGAFCHFEGTCRHRAAHNSSSGTTIDDNVLQCEAAHPRSTGFASISVRSMCPLHTVGWSTKNSTLRPVFQLLSPLTNAMRRAMPAAGRKHEGEEGIMHISPLIFQAHITGRGPVVVLADLGSLT